MMSIDIMIQVAMIMNIMIMNNQGDPPGEENIAVSFFGEASNSISSCKLGRGYTV